jgi:hypothetical protein
MAAIPTFELNVLERICDVLAETTTGLTGSEIGRLLMNLNSDATNDKAPPPVRGAKTTLAEVFVREVVLLETSWICLRIFVTFRSLYPAHCSAQGKELHWLADGFDLYLPAIQKTRRS